MYFFSEGLFRIVKKLKCSSLFPIIFMIFLKKLILVGTLDIIGDPLITLSLNKLLERACLFKIQRGGFVSLCLWGTSALCVQLNSNGTWPQLLPNFMHFFVLDFYSISNYYFIWISANSELLLWRGQILLTLVNCLCEDHLLLISKIPLFFLNFW